MRSIKKAKKLGLIDSGPWDNESDSKFDFVYKSYKCFGKRNGSLAWCGYIEGKFTYEEMAILENKFHGGITYDGLSETSDGQVLGFDCGHIDDLAPLPVLNLTHPREYRTEEYVRNILKDSVDAIVAINKKRDFNRHLGKL